MRVARGMLVTSLRAAAAHEPSVTPSSFGSTPLLNAKRSVRLYSLPVSSLPAIVTSIWCSPVGDVAGVDPLHAALLQGFELLEAVDAVRDGLAVDLDLHRVQAQRVALGERDEHGQVRVRGIEEPLLQARELGGDAQDVGLDLLHLLVEAFHLLAIAGIRATAAALANTPSAATIAIQNFFSVRIPTSAQTRSANRRRARCAPRKQVTQGAVNDRRGGSWTPARIRGAAAMTESSVRLMATSSCTAWAVATRSDKAARVDGL